MYIAHVRERDKKVQPLHVHLINVQKLAEQYGEKLGLTHVAGLAGLLHDLGKYSDIFQDYISKAAFTPEEVDKKRGDVDHSTAGGKLLFSYFHNKENTFYEKLLVEIVGNAIISHHSNLQDYLSPSISSDFLRRVQEKEVPEYELAVKRFFNETMSKIDFFRYVSTALEELKEFSDKSPTQCFFLTKYIFSCLIDADRTDTRNFEDESYSDDSRQSQELFPKYYRRLLHHLDSLQTKNDANQSIQKLRSDLSRQCDQYAEKPSGIYTLSIPTGGGKTLASLRYALKHAQKFNKQRIIYVVPFTTIIEQNAQTVRTVLNDEEHILEHHSNVIEEDILSVQKDDEQNDGFISKNAKLKLSHDNWDSPIIFTTLVQFLDVFYASGTRNTRRLHNLSHAVIVFDEVQKVPIKCVSLFNEALNFLKRYARCCILLCTATQPTLEQVKHSLLKDRDGEIVPNLPEVAKAFKRVEIVDRTSESLHTDALADWIKTESHVWESTLVILNTKKVVKDLYEQLNESSFPVFHLSTSMCAAHRKDQLQQIRQLLDAKTPFVCVTTQLIEAGVDVSFKCVIRSLAGLDSIAQGAGRCNRHGEENLQNVYVINHADEKLSRLKEIKVGKEISANIMARFRKKPNKYENNLLSQKAMQEYFLYFYQKMEADLNYYIPEVDEEITKLLLSVAAENSYVAHYEKKTGVPFPLLLNGSYKTAAQYFKVIDQHTIPVIVPYGEEGKDLIAKLNSEEQVKDLAKLLKKAQQYTIDLYPQVFEQLNRDQAIISHFDGLLYELKETWYSDEYGLDIEGESEMAFMSF